LARQVTTGFEWNSLVSESPQYLGAGGAPTVQTGTVRSGAYAVSCSSSTVTYLRWQVLGSAGTNYYVRVAFNLAGLPAAGEWVTLSAMWSSGPTLQSTVRLTDTGELRLTRADGVVTTPSPAVTVSTGVWYVLEHRVFVDSTTVANNTAEFRLNGVSAVIATGSTDAWSSLLPPSEMWVGRATSSASPGAFAVFLDDLAINDGTGGSQNSWPGGASKIVLLKPISLNTNGGSWTDSAAATTSAALTDAIDNTPPTGIADTTASAGHQDRNAAANSSLDMNLTTYATAGIGAGDTVNVVEPQINVGAPVVTAAKTGSFGISANPVIANRVFTGGATAAANFWRGVAAGTYPTGWGWERGTVTYAPSVTVGSSPVARVTITGGTTTRIAMVDALGMYVDYTPATKAPPFQARTARNTLLRR
jgi:hypothetical protein